VRGASRDPDFPFTRKHETRSQDIATTSTVHQRSYLQQQQRWQSQKEKAVCSMHHRKSFVSNLNRILTVTSNETYTTLERQPSSYKSFSTFALEKEKQYQQQYGDMYFLRLAKLKPAVEAIAAQAWNGFQIAGETVQRVERVLDVRQGKLCWVAGTIYMEMPLKPNILDDISKDVSCCSCGEIVGC
jgi:hypothetical protein